MIDPIPTSTGPAGPGPAGPGPAGGWGPPHQGPMRRGGLPFGGLVLVGIGAIVLFHHFGLHLRPHWWAVILLVPAVSLLVAAIRRYRADGRLSRRSGGPAVAGAVLLTLALAVFFGAGGGVLWPVLLIGLGLAIVARRAMR